MLRKFIALFEGIGRVWPFVLAFLTAVFLWQFLFADGFFGRIFFLFGAVGCGFLVLDEFVSIEDIPGMKLLLPKDGAEERERNLVEAIFVAAGEIAYIGKAEIDASERAAIIALVRRARSSQEGDEEIMAEFRMHSAAAWSEATASKVDPADRLTVLTCSIEVAAAGPEFGEQQRSAIKRIGMSMGFEDLSLDDLIRTIAPQQPSEAAPRRPPPKLSRQEIAFSDALEVLGLERGATLAEVEEQYRSLVMIVHPDRVAPEDRGEAAGHFKAITEAYNLIRERLEQEPS